LRTITVANTEVIATPERGDTNADSAVFYEDVTRRATVETCPPGRPFGEDFTLLPPRPPG
jgi:hypothetical protein